MTTVPETTTPVQSGATLRALADRARARYAGEASSIHRGLVMALDGGVTLKEDGAALVSRTRDDEVFFIVRDGHCDCQGVRRAPAGRCPHVWAACLVRQAQRPPVRYFATYTAPDGAEHAGIATQTAQSGWLFVAEDGLEPLFASSRSLLLCGRVDLADAQMRTDTRVQGSRVLTLLAR